VLENIDTGSFVVVQILSSASLHTLFMDEKGFDSSGIGERTPTQQIAICTSTLEVVAY